MTENEKKLVDAAEVALLWANKEVKFGACEKCDPGNEGAEIWGEIAYGLSLALEPYAAEVKRLRDEREQRNAEMLREFYGKPTP